MHPNFINICMNHVQYDHSKIHRRHFPRKEQKPAGRYTTSHRACNFVISLIYVNYVFDTIDANNVIYIFYIIVVYVNLRKLDSNFSKIGSHDLPYKFWGCLRDCCYFGILGNPWYWPQNWGAKIYTCFWPYNIHETNPTACTVIFKSRG